MTTYTLSIEDRVVAEGKVTERAVVARWDVTTAPIESKYNPNADRTEPFRYEGPFNTSRTIAVPMRQVAHKVALNYHGIPQIKYDASVNEAQQKLFSTILTQEVRKKMASSRSSAKADGKN